MKNFCSLCLLTFFLCGCDTLQVIKDKIEYNEKMDDQSCIKKAIENTAGVKFIKQKSSSIGLFSTKQDVYYSFYSIIGTKEEITASVQLTLHKEKPPEIENYSGKLNSRFLPEDEPVIKKAIEAVNKSLLELCSTKTN